ncbi:MAG: hypothetical protein P1Q69_15940, partial [Candidatus Thorarchaeota archaeon]|nr:hypothetical protein [Candidatus Thorarchaeota archaeon]
MTTPTHNTISHALILNCIRMDISSKSAADIQMHGTATIVLKAVTDTESAESIAFFPAIPLTANNNVDTMM